MSKKNSMNKPASGQFSKGRSAEEELATLKALVDKLKQEPGKLLEVAVMAGIYKPDGKLTKTYGGE